VRLSVHVRKFFCRNPACPRVVFTERLPALLAPSSRRTQRLGGEQRQLALDQGGEAASRTATRQGMPVSPRTLLRLARRMPVLEHPTPKILGVDDFAFRKGQTYGTLLVDLERHQPIDMLADRSADTLADWLSRHPGVAIITRDRAPDYADGATRGAPDAIQIADRFHVLQNAREMLQRLLERQQANLRLAPRRWRPSAMGRPSSHHRRLNHWLRRFRLFRGSRKANGILRRRPSGPPHPRRARTPGAPSGGRVMTPYATCMHRG